MRVRRGVEELDGEVGLTFLKPRDCFILSFNHPNEVLQHMKIC